MNELLRRFIDLLPWGGPRKPADLIMAAEQIDEEAEIRIEDIRLADQHWHIDAPTDFKDILDAEA